MNKDHESSQITAIVENLIRSVGSNLNMDDEQAKEVAGAFFYGVINAYYTEYEGSPGLIRSVTVQVLTGKLFFSRAAAEAFCQFLIECTDKTVHPTVNAIIHRGIDGYYQIYEHNINTAARNLTEVLQIIREDGDE